MDEKHPDGTGGCSHPVLSSAYDSQPPLNWPSPPTSEQYTFVNENDSTSYLAAGKSSSSSRSRDYSREGSPADIHGRRLARGVGASPLVNEQPRLHAGARSFADSGRSGQKPACCRADSSDDDEVASERDCDTFTGTPSTWSSSGGERDGSFNKGSPDRQQAFARSREGGNSMVAFAAAGAVALAAEQMPYRRTTSGARKASLESLDALSSVSVKPASAPRELS